MGVYEMFWNKMEESYEPIIQVENGFVPCLYICGMNTPVCTQLLINKEEYTIGTGAENDGVMNFPMLGMSRQHCRIECRNGKYTLEDCHSTNGVFVNNRAVRDRVALQGKGIISIAGNRMIFTWT